MPHTSHTYSQLIHKPAGRLGLLIMTDILMFGATDAGNVASYILIIGLLLLGATIYQMVLTLLAGVSLYSIHVSRPRRLAVGITGLIGLLVALQSVGELGLRDVFVLVPLVILGYAYSFYGKPAIIKPVQPV